MQSIHSSVPSLLATALQQILRKLNSMSHIHNFDESDISTTVFVDGLSSKEEPGFIIR